MVEILELVRDLELNDCWIGAGFVRNKIWDVKHQKNRTTLNDLDVIYFDENRNSEKDDLIIESKLKIACPDINWSVKNQARMHIKNKHTPYKNCYDAISYWPEIATSLAVRLCDDEKIEYIAPYGIDDLFNLIVRPTPKIDLTVYHTRVQTKKWKKTWEKLIILEKKNLS